MKNLKSPNQILALFLLAFAMIVAAPSCNPPGTTAPGPQIDGVYNDVLYQVLLSEIDPTKAGIYFLHTMDKLQKCHKEADAILDTLCDFSATQIVYAAAPKGEPGWVCEEVNGLPIDIDGSIFYFYQDEYAIPTPSMMHFVQVRVYEHDAHPAAIPKGKGTIVLNDPSNMDKEIRDSEPIVVPIESDTPE
jgi:hypothetical protein